MENRFHKWLKARKVDFSNVSLEVKDLSKKFDNLSHESLQKRITKNVFDIIEHVRKHKVISVIERKCESTFGDANDKWITDIISEHVTEFKSNESFAKQTIMYGASDTATLCSWNRVKKTVNGKTFDPAINGRPQTEKEWATFEVWPFVSGSEAPVWILNNYFWESNKLQKIQNGTEITKS